MTEPDPCTLHQDMVAGRVPRPALHIETSLYSASQSSECPLQYSQPFLPVTPSTPLQLGHYSFSNILYQDSTGKAAAVSEYGQVQEGTGRGSKHEIVSSLEMEEEVRQEIKDMFKSPDKPTQRSSYEDRDVNKEHRRFVLEKREQVKGRDSRCQACALM